MNSQAWAAPSRGPWPRRNPSRWSHRLAISLLAAGTAGVASYLGAYQLGWISGVWDPVFGAGTRRVLDSRISQAVRAAIVLPDAWLGAFAYLVDVPLALAGGRERWRRHPWLVLLLGINVLASAGVGVALISAQVVVIGAGCLLCIVTTGGSLALLALTYEELRASWRLVRRRGLLRPTTVARPTRNHPPQVAACRRGADRPD